MQRIERHASFGGFQEVWEHDADTLGCAMRFGIYLPPRAADAPCPTLTFLSGLTCTEQNVITKSGIQQHAAEHGLVVIAPDTSPRGEDVADDDAYDLGQGAGFYLNATREPWARHYRMYDYVTRELPALVAASFPVTDARGITGHSMGGHGALVIALKNPGMFQSVSAFAPIVAPTRVPWGEKAFSAYLGEDREAWKAWDACELIAGAGERLPLRIDQGGDDPFLAEQLRPEWLEQACAAAGHPCEVHLRPGHDHSYYFIASYMGEHVAHHAAALNA